MASLMSVPVPGGGHHGDRARGVLDDLATDRTEQQRANAAASSRADDDEVGVFGGVDENIGSEALDHMRGRHGCTVVVAQAGDQRLGELCGIALHVGLR